MSKSNFIERFRKGLNPPYSWSSAPIIASLLVTFLAIPIITFVVFEGTKENSTENLKKTSQIESAKAQETQVKGLTKKILDLNKQLSEEPNKQASIEKKMLSTAVEREAILLELIETDPLSVSQIALSPKLRSTLPKKIQDHIERPATLEGPLEVLHSDDLERNISDLDYLLTVKEGDKKVSLHFVQEEETDILTGSKVRAKGLRLKDKMVVPTTKEKDLKVITRKTKVLAASNVKKVAVILLNFQNNKSEPFNEEFVRKVTFTSSSSVNAYFKEVSLGNLSLTGIKRADGDVYGWYTLPYNDTVCDELTWQAKAEDFVRQDYSKYYYYDYFIFAFPRTSACPYSGAAWLLGNSSYINGAFNTRVVGHELGHNFGLLHASSLNCTDEKGQRVPISDSCKRNEYGDPFDIMGSKIRHMNTQHKARLGWYEGSNIKKVTESGTYTLSPIETQTSGTKALIISKQNLNTYAHYYLEYRKPFGFDNFKSTDPVVNGVSIRIGIDHTTNGIGNTYLIDTTPETSTFFDAPLLAGRTFEDKSEGLKIEVLGKEGASIRVKVTFEPKPNPCVRANPSASISPLSQWATMGQIVPYTISITNNDNENCKPSTLEIKLTLPKNIRNANLSISGITLKPGESGTRQISITSDLLPTYDKIYHTFTAEIRNSLLTEYSTKVNANYNIYSPTKPPPPPPDGTDKDSDGDGFTDNAEISMGTDPLDNCADDSNDAAWPPDFDNNKLINIMDVLSIKPVFDSKKGDGVYNSRFDLNVDDIIDINDVMLMKPIFKTTCSN